MKLVVIMPALGDYHIARLERLQAAVAVEKIELHIVVMSRQSSLYAHEQRRRIKSQELSVVWLADGGARLLRLTSVLRDRRPDFVFTMGYHSPLSWLGLIAAKAVGAKVYFYSDSKADDQARSQLRERLKSYIVSRFDGALVAGSKHRDYFATLGMSKDRIQTGYDVIDNRYFEARAERFRKRTCPGAPYVLVVSRLIKRKRVDRAIALYAASFLASKGVRLLVVGEGEERKTLEAQIEAQKLSSMVNLVGAVPSTRMAYYYAHASMLWLCSEYDQWGLCVNEAMASGVPCLVTERCGVANEMVISYENGFVWDGEDLESAENFIDLFFDNERFRERLRARAKDVARRWGLDRFSEGTMKLLAHQE